MALLVWACAIVTGIIAITFLPFASGGHDPMAVPLAAMAWVLGRVGLLLVPVGGLWLWVWRRPAAPSGPPAWLVRVTLGSCVLIAIVMVLVAFAASNSQLLAAVTAAVATLLMLRVGRSVRATRTTLSQSRTRPAAVAAILIVAPIVVLAAQTMFIDAATTRARNRIIANGSPLIEEIERYRARRGTYPDSLFSIWGDYKPSIVGVERYHYERSGDGYNVIVREPSIDFGARRFVVYNPLDRQRVTVHEQDRLLLDEAGLDADNAGYTLVTVLPQPHWKLFSFLS